jgi:hypothetical protein
MLHVQPGQKLAFEKALFRWVKGLSGVQDLPHGVIQIKPIPSLKDAEAIKLYMGKGLEPNLAQLWRIQPVDGGIVLGRKAYTSRNLGPAEWQQQKKAYREGRRAA